MIITKKALPRRTFLRGMGATRGAPAARRDGAVDDRARQNAGRAGAAARLRLHADGMRPAALDAAGRRHARPSCRRRSSRSRRSCDQLTVITQPGAEERLSRARMRRRTRPSSARPRRSGPKARTTTWARRSIRSRRKQIGQQTLLPSLELSMDLLQTVGQCDNGYACVYQNNLSWSSPTTPLPAEAHPRHRVRAPVRRRRQRGRSPRGAARDGPACSIRCATTSRACRRSSGPRIATGSASISRPSAKWSAAFRRPRPQTADNAAAGSRSAGRRAGGLRRSREADVRSAGAGAAGRRHARHHVPARARNEQPDLHRDRRVRSASSAHAPRQRSGEDREDGEDQRVPRVAVRRTSSRS